MSTLFGEINRISAAKQDIRSAIEEKGGSVSGLIDNYAEAIRNLPSGGSSEIFGILSYSNNSAEPYSYFVIDNLTDYNVLVNLNLWSGKMNFSNGLSLDRSAVREFIWGPAAEGTSILPTFRGFDNLKFLGKMPNGPTTVPSYFLSGCSSLNSPLIFPDTLTSMAPNTVMGLNKFDYELDLSNTKLTALPEGFMSSCSVFSRAVILPSTIDVSDREWYGLRWFRNCPLFTGPFVVGNVPAPMAASSGSSYFDGQRESFSVSDSSALAYQRGITFRGETASDWKAVFPDSSVNFYYRNTIADNTPWPNFE